MSSPAVAPIQSLLRFFLENAATFRRGSRILVACSGGPDSVALARGLKSLMPPLTYKFHVGHVNHALRGADSVKDAQFTRELAAELQWPFHLASRPVSRKGTAIEETAREKRYEALLLMARRNRCNAILTAHTSDDQIETVLMNLLRGSGPDGLSGMESVRPLGNSTIKLARPLLGVSKAELLDWLRGWRFKYRQDRSNKNTKFLRNWVRLQLVPQLERKAPGFKARLTRLATLARDEKAYWNGVIASLEGALLTEYRGGRLLDLGGLLSYPPAVQRRFLRRVLGGDIHPFEAIERLRNWMQSPPSGGRQFQLRKGWIAERLSKSKGSPSARLFWFKSTPVKKDKHLS